MIIAGDDQFGFSIKKFAKGVGKGIAKGAKGVASGAKFIGKQALRPVAFIAHGLTAPLRNRVHKLRDGRALKLAQDRRRSNVPNAAERAEAKAWTKVKLKSGGPQGYLLALFAGPPTDAEMNTFLGAVGVDDAAIAAAIPILATLLTSVISKATKSGEIAVVGTAVAQQYAQQQFAPAPEAPAEVPVEVPTEAMEGYFGAAGNPNVGYGVGVGLGTVALAAGLFLAFKD